MTEKNKIFVRKDTGTKEANKYDIDIMYYDRKNIEPDYLVNIDAIKIKFGGFPKKYETIQFVIFFSIENLGKRPLAISNITLHAKQESHTVDFELEGKLTQLGLIADHNTRDLIIKCGDVKFVDKLIFIAPGVLKPEDIKDFKLNSELWATLHLSNNKKLSVRINYAD